MYMTTELMNIITEAESYADDGMNGDAIAQAIGQATQALEIIDFRPDYDDDKWADAAERRDMALDAMDHIRKNGTLKLSVEDGNCD